MFVTSCACWLRAVLGEPRASRTLANAVFRTLYIRTISHSTDARRRENFVNYWHFIKLGTRSLSPVVLDSTADCACALNVHVYTRIQFIPMLVYSRSPREHQTVLFLNIGLCAY
uniref:Putative secreted protein n=1 Tax=Rhipicephalus microplus TaxID=6941 RepID=A0A6M2DA69_RHIMP